jgi:hypothetical protein
VGAASGARARLTASGDIVLPASDSTRAPEVLPNAVADHLGQPQPGVRHFELWLHRLDERPRLEPGFKEVPMLVRVKW